MSGPDPVDDAYFFDAIDGLPVSEISGRRRMWRPAAAASIGVLLVTVAAAAGVMLTDSPGPQSAARVDPAPFQSIVEPSEYTAGPTADASASPSPAVFSSAPQPPRPSAPAPSKVSVAAKAFVSHQSHKCLHASPSDGSPVQLWTCDGSDTERWAVYRDGTIRSGELCLDAAWAATANGTIVQLARCNGGPAQQFHFNAAHDIVGLHADRCLDVRDFGTSNGSAVQLWDCAGSDNQKWSYV